MLGAGLTTLLCKKNTVAKSNEEEIGRSNFQEWANLPESSKEGYGSQRTILSMIVVKMNPSPITA
jgi:hypothetical protein